MSATTAAAATSKPLGMKENGTTFGFCESRSPDRKLRKLSRRKKLALSHSQESIPANGRVKVLRKANGRAK